MACFLEHLRGHVDPDNATGGADLARGDERVEAGTGADVHDPLARLQSSKGERVADTGERLDRMIRERVDCGRVVAEAGGERPSRMEVKRPVRIGGDVAVLDSHLLTESVGINEENFGHVWSPFPGCHGLSGSFPFREAIDQAACSEAATVEFACGVLGVHAVRSAAVGDDLAVLRQHLEVSS